MEGSKPQYTNCNSNAYQQNFGDFILSLYLAPTQESEDEDDELPVPPVPNGDFNAAPLVPLNGDFNAVQGSSSHYNPPVDAIAGPSNYDPTAGTSTNRDPRPFQAITKKTCS